MRRHNSENEAIKRDYVEWLRNANGRDESTLDIALAAIHAFEAFNRYASFKTFRREQAISFKLHLSDQRHATTGKPLAKATLHGRVRALKAFFEWLAREPGYRRHVVYSDAAYFNLTANDARVATARREQRAPTLEQVIHVLEVMPAETVVQRRDRAVVAFIILTGARDRAVTSMRIKHVRLAAGQVDQDAREVKTKRAKTFTSCFYPVGELPRRIVTDWVAELRIDLLFSGDDPIFPASARSLNDQGQFHAARLSRVAWSTAAPIRAIFQEAFTSAGLEYFPPHSFRRTLQRLAYDLELTLLEQRAWSHSLGHDSIQTTVTGYGQLSLDEQTKVMARLAVVGPRRSVNPANLVESFQAFLASQPSQ